MDHTDNMDRVNKQAEDWFARLLAPDCSAHERAEFARWRDARPAHAEAYAATQRLWDRLDGLADDDVIGPFVAEALAGADAAATHATAPAKPAPRRALRRWAIPTAMAASLLLAALALYQGTRIGVVPAKEFHTGDAIDSVVLDDGSRVRMDLATRIDVNFGTQRRDVDLKSGRAVFDVARDGARPFVVEADAATITALGTRFQVDRDAGEIRVSLAEGVVTLGRAGDAAEAMRLTPGEQGVYSLRDKQWAKRKIDIEPGMSWALGFHVFADTPLDDAVRQINRYSPHKLRLADPTLAALKVSGSFHIGNAEMIARALPEVLPVRVSKDGDDIVLARP